MEKQRNRNIITFIIFDIILIAAVILYFGVIRQTPHPVKIEGIYLSHPQTISNFQLTDNKGKPFTKDNLKGHWNMVFFGFTNCGMVCPVTMAALNKMIHTLEKTLPANQLPQIVFISVDPERDTVQKMNDYVNSFNSHFIGLRGDMTETVRLEKELHIVAQKMQADGKGKNHYMINHSAEILLFNPNAELQAYFSYPHQPEQMVKDYQLVLEASQT